MRGTSLGLAVVAAFLATVTATQESLDKVPAAIVNPVDGKGDSSVDDQGRFLFGSYSTTTYTVVSASTSTVFYSCLSGTQAARCQGRRKRKDLGLLRETPVVEEDDKVELAGSLDEGTAEEKGVVPTDGDGKFAFTVWTTSRTTTSVTVIYTNTSTTIRLSYYCVVGQIDLPVFPC
ncbi:uncharacterized protein [Panulirus ornatus]